MWLDWDQRKMRGFAGEFASMNSEAFEAASKTSPLKV